MPKAREPTGPYVVSVLHGVPEKRRMASVGMRCDLQLTRHHSGGLFRTMVRDEEASESVRDA